MGSNTITLLGLAADPESASARACQRLVEFFRPYQAKELARIFDCSPRTAEGWKRGNWPGSRHEHAIVAHFGRAWLDYVYGPLLPAEDQALSAQLAEIEGRLAAVRTTVETIERGDHGAGAVAVGTGAARALAEAGRATGCAATARRGGKTRLAGARMASVGTGAGALALVLMVVMSAVPDQAKAVRLLRGPGGARVMRVLQGRELL